MCAERQPRPPLAPRKNVLERENLFVTVASTVVAVAAAVAAYWSSYEAHKARVDDERPTLIAEPIDRVTPTYPYKRIKIKNIGKSSATNIQVICKSVFESGSAATAWQSADLHAHADTFPYLYPTIWVAEDCPVAATGYTPGATGRVVELGVIRYLDVKGDSYLSPFCLTFDLSGAQIDVQHLDVHECADARNLPLPE